ncbi:hypothetical protein JHD48_08595 [Sulfurimonas sp. SAG-AH-194-I05]|nr:hypothetical protein [Sulfurimonas sp. SAG-AH-194-I05]MDF1875792.1 hypothetical protein [Sulfurimonas sp. SAG-AH-194-I05]
MIETGLQAFDLFQKRHNTMISKEYPSLMIRDVKINPNEFNPNKNYLNFKYENVSPSSPFHFLTLIPSESKLEQSSLLQSISFLHFLNWACYFYPKLKSDYDQMSSPSKGMIKEEAIISRELAEIITQLNTQGNAIRTTDKQIEQDAKKRLSKNHTLKDTKFLSICKFYARAWFEENFGAECSLKFAYYVSEYISSNENTDQQKCKYYKANSHYKQEVHKLFASEETKALKAQMKYIAKNFSWSVKIQGKQKILYIESHINEIDYNKYNFSILLEWTYGDDKLPIYTIRILQLRCDHYFYKFARLHLDRYTSNF